MFATLDGENHKNDLSSRRFISLSPNPKFFFECPDENLILAVFQEAT